MTRLLSVVISAVIIITLHFGCKEDGVAADDRPAGLYATVIDSAGNPVSDAEVHYLFYTSTNPLVLNAWIQYVLTVSRTVTLKVYDPLGREFSTLINGVQQPAGTHTIQFYDSTAANGVYSYRLQAGDSLGTGSFYIRDDDIVRLQKKTPLTVSDGSGRFFLSPAALGIGRTFYVPFSPETISDSISIILVKENYKPFMQSFRLNVSTSDDRTFTLEAN
jgi:hypothetical protein